jgi:hypothetical protein
MKSTLLALVSLLFVSCLSDNEPSKPVDYTSKRKEVGLQKNKLTATETVQVVLCD